MLASIEDANWSDDQPASSASNRFSVYHLSERRTSIREAILMGFEVRIALATVRFLDKSVGFSV